MSFTVHGNSTTSAAGSDVSQATSAIAVTVGDVVIVYGGNGGSGAISSIDDGNGHTATLLSTGSNLSIRHVIGYWLSAPTGGSIIYTVNFGASVVNRIAGVWSFTPSAAATLDGATSGPATGSSATILSNTLTTAGSDCLIVGACFGTNAGFSAPLIGGAAATSSDSDGGGAIWYKATTGSGVAAQISQSSSAWVVDAISFKIASAANNLLGQGVM